MNFISGRKTAAVVLALLFGLPVFGQYNSNDVTPPATPSGKLTGASNGRQVGGGSNGRAYRLNGNAASAVDLNAPGFVNLIAMATDDTQQCGYGYSLSTYGNHAIMWSSS